MTAARPLRAAASGAPCRVTEATLALDRKPETDRNSVQQTAQMLANFDPHTDVLPGCGSRAVRLAGRHAQGITLLELAIATAVLCIIAAVAVPAFQSQVRRTQVNRAISDLAKIGLAIEHYRLGHNEAFPNDLGDLTGVPATDPWGFPYRYLDFSSDASGVKQQIRKDHNLHPLNTSFDLYSVGPDGDSKAPLTAKASRDDVIWARDGGFIGIATDF